MNYKNIHDLIIERAKNRTIDEYTEIHHIIPKSIGGTDEKTNLVNLTFKEHYIVHILLTKIYPDNKELLYAAWMMSNRSSNISGRKYSTMKKRYIELLKDKHNENPEYYKTMGQKNKGIPKSNKENYKKPKSIETCNKMSESAYKRPKVSCDICGKIVSKENLGNHKKAHTGEIKPSKETTNKISQSVKNIPRIPCTLCDMTINPGNMWRHMKKHERQKNDLQCF